MTHLTWYDPHQIGRTHTFIQFVTFHNDHKIEIVIQTHKGQIVFIYSD